MGTKEFVVYCFSLYMTACSGYRPLFEIPRSALTLDNVQGEEQPLQTGFLVGTAAESTSRIEIALNRGTYEADTGSSEIYASRVKCLDSRQGSMFKGWAA